MNPFFKFFAKANCIKVLFYFLLPFYAFVELHAQGNQQEQIVFMNTPVLF